MVAKVETTQQAEIPITYLRPAHGWAALNLRDLWKYRELLYFLTWRDIKVRYKQAVLGIGWAVIQPLLNMVIFSIIFGQLARLPSDGIPYPIFSYAALLPWYLFAGALTRSSASLVRDANLLTKVYFPRLVIPFATVLAALVDFCIAFLVLMGMTFYYGYHLTWTMLWLVPLTLLALLSAVAVGAWFSALNVQYRDIQQMVPFLVQAWMYASPVAYSANMIPTGKWRLVYALNPMTGVIQGFRWALFGGSPPDLAILISTAMVILLLVTGLFYFRRMERTFADMV
jgi:lipopolysaccharide transport system permease protein